MKKDTTSLQLSLIINLWDHNYGNNGIELYTIISEIRNEFHENILMSLLSNPIFNEKGNSIK